MIIGQKYVDKKEVLNRVITRIETDLDNIADNGGTISELCSLEFIVDLVKTKIDVLRNLLDSPLTKEFDPSIYTEDVNACKLVYGDIEAEYHLRLEGNDKVRGMDFLLFGDVLNPQDDKSFETEIELLAEGIAKECGNPYKFKNREISYIKLTHTK